MTRKSTLVKLLIVIGGFSKLVSGQVSSNQLSGTINNVATTLNFISVINSRTTIPVWSEIEAEAMSQELIEKDSVCRSEFPRCVYCTQQPPCVWCSSTKQCRHPDALIAEDKMRMLLTLQRFNKTSSEYASYVQTLADQFATDGTTVADDCAVCGEGDSFDSDCLLDGCGLISAEPLAQFGAIWNVEMVELALTRYPEHSWVVAAQSHDWTSVNDTSGRIFFPRNLVAGKFQWMVTSESGGNYELQVQVGNYTVQPACSVVATEPEQCTAPTHIVHEIHNETSYGEIGETVSQPRRPTLDEWSTCFSYLVDKYADPEPYAPDLPDESDPSWEFKPIQVDATQIPCCTLCCCSASRYNSSRTFFFETRAELLSFLSPEEFENGYFPFTYDNYTVTVEREYVSVCAMNSSSMNVSCVSVNATDGMNAVDQLNMFNINTRNSSFLCPEISCEGVLCSDDMECPEIECLLDSIQCPAFETCAAGPNELGGGTYQQDPIFVDIVTENFVGAEVVEKVEVARPSRTCSASKKDSTYNVSLSNPCSAIDFYTQSHGKNLQELFQLGLYWDDTMIDPVKIHSPHDSPPPPNFDNTAIHKMLFEDSEESEMEWFVDDETELGQHIHNKLMKDAHDKAVQADCVGNQIFNPITELCECSEFWTGDLCTTPAYHVNCDGLDLYTCALVRELLSNCQIEEADEIDSDCAKQGHTAEGCLASGYPFRERDLYSFNTINNTIWLRNNNQFASPGGGWVLSFAPPTGVVSSGIVDCNCVGMRCFCPNGTFGNVTESPIPEEEIIVSSEFDFDHPDLYDSFSGTWHTGILETEYESQTRGLDTNSEYHDVRVDGAGATPILDQILSERGWLEPIALICSKCVGTPEVLNQVCSDSFLNQCHTVEGMTRHPLCNLCSDDLVNQTIVTSNMQSNVTTTTSYMWSTEKPLTEAEANYQQDQWTQEALDTRSQIISNDVGCHLIEEDIAAATREDDMACHRPNNLCQGLMDAEINNHPARIGEEGYKNFGPLRCPHVRHCCITEVDTIPEATCTFEHTCVTDFIHPYQDCGKRPSGCMPSLTMCEFNYTNFEGNAICGKLDPDQVDPWTTNGRAPNAAGCAAPAWVDDQVMAQANNLEVWYTLIGNPAQEKMYSGTGVTIVDASSAVCVTAWSDYCAAMQGESSPYAPTDGFCEAYVDQDGNALCYDHNNGPRANENDVVCGMVNAAVAAAA